MKRSNSKGRVLFAGQAYYNAWYLSRELRKLGWKADLLNWDPRKSSQSFYHGEDFRFRYHSGSALRTIFDVLAQLSFFIRAIFAYDIFHFSNTDCIRFGPYVTWFFRKLTRSEFSEIRLLKLLGKKIVYSNNGCHDGTLRSTFRALGPESLCDTYCAGRDCTDEAGIAWGENRNALVDYQILLGGNHHDYNIHPTVHEVPEFYCLDRNFWYPELLIPSNYLLPFPEETVKIYHSIGNFDSRSAGGNMTIKSTHVYLDVVERLKREGHKVEIIFFHDVPNRKIRYYQAQADIFADMLTFGFFGANIREGMMLGKPCICYLRPEWLEQMRGEIPGYVDEIPIISATPETIYEVLKELVVDREKRREIGRKSREFAVKWHSSEAAAQRFDAIYAGLLEQLRR